LNQQTALNLQPGNERCKQIHEAPAHEAVTTTSSGKIAAPYWFAGVAQFSKAPDFVISLNSRAASASWNPAVQYERTQQQATR
jgi:hypothetical protein